MKAIRYKKLYITVIFIMENSILDTKAMEKSL